jgi:tape measure domain-containing protein
MANAATFSVQLKDLISGPARAAAGAIASIRKQFQASNQIPGMKVGRGKGGRFEKVTEAGRFHKMFENMKGGDKFDEMAGKVSKVGLWAGTAAAGLAMAKAAAVGLAVVDFTKSVVDMAAFSETSKLAFMSLVHSEEPYNRAIKLAEDYGLGLQDTAMNMQKLLAAQFKVGEAEELIKLTTDLRAIGSSAMQAESAIRAITQIKAKGKLQSEELVGQLAEAGVATTLVFKELSRLTGKSEEDVRGMLKKGAIGAELGIQAIKGAIMAKTNVSAAGEAGKGFADATLGGMLARLSAAPERMFKKIADSVDFILPRVKAVVKSIEVAIASITPGGGMTTFLDNMLHLLEMAVPMAIELGRGFTTGFAAISDAMGVNMPIEELRERFYNFGQSMATVVKWGVYFAKMFIWVVEAVTTKSGMAVLAFVTIGSAVIKLATALGTLGTVFGATAGAGVLGKMGMFGTGLSMLANPFGLVIAGAIAAAAIIWWFWDDIKEVFENIQIALGWKNNTGVGNYASRRKKHEAEPYKALAMPEMPDMASVTAHSATPPPATLQPAVSADDLFSKIDAHYKAAGNTVTIGAVNVSTTGDGRQIGRAVVDTVKSQMGAHDALAGS